MQSVRDRDCLVTRVTLECIICYLNQTPYSLNCHSGSACMQKKYPFFSNPALNVHKYLRLLAEDDTVCLFQIIWDVCKALVHILSQFLSFCSSLQRNESPEDLPDETFNRRATLLKSLSMVMCCSPVYEKQALFALFQSYKENSIEENLIKKVHNNGGGKCVMVYTKGRFKEGCSTVGLQCKEETLQTTRPENPTSFINFVY